MTNYLKAVFWDYPELTKEKKILSIIRRKDTEELQKWLLTRFLKYGRVVDTLKFFNIKLIARYLEELKLDEYSHKKWQRMIEVYGAARK